MAAACIVGTYEYRAWNLLFHGICVELISQLEDKKEWSLFAVMTTI